eukprot:5759889-Amphidinium_carterae.2
MIANGTQIPNNSKAREGAHGYDETGCVCGTNNVVAPEPPTVEEEKDFWQLPKPRPTGIMAATTIVQNWLEQYTYYSIKLARERGNHLFLFRLHV